MQHQIYRSEGQRRLVSRRAFTLVEVLVALAIFVLLLAIILIPLNMGFHMLHLGKAQSDVQSATQEVVDRMRGDLARAVYVFPNTQVPPVTDKAPYYATGSGKHYGPYIQLAGVDEITSTTPTTSVCGDVASTANDGVSNLSRLDMILAKTDGNSLITPLQPSYYIVSYYSRRRNVAKPYQPIDNPIVLYRAQIPYYSPANTGYLKPDGTVAAAGDYDVNADTSNNRYGNVNCSAQGSWWLAESKFGEPNLEPLTNEDGATNPASAFTLYGSHVSLLSDNMGMVTGVDYRGYDSIKKEFVTTYTQPKSTFICADTNRDGVIDQVRLTILLQNATPGSSGPNGPQINLPQVVDLPNARSVSNVH